MNTVRLDPTIHARLQAGGVLVPSPLALGPDTRMLENWQRLLTLYYIKSGARAVIPGAHTGEFANNDLDLYTRWLPLVREMVREHGRDMVLMAAVGGPHALAQAERAAAAGYEIIMISPTAFGDRSEHEALLLCRNIASILPTFGFYLQPAVGGRELGHVFWSGLYEFSYGAKAAAFDEYRTHVMLEAAAHSARRHELVFATGNDCRIVEDLGTRFPFRVGDQWVHVEFSAGLLGHYATDTHAAVAWTHAVLGSKQRVSWTFPVSQADLAVHVTYCNSALFDALHQFQNSVWGVKTRLTALGLLPAPVCFHETGRAGQPESIARAYGDRPFLSDEPFVREHLTAWKAIAGVR